MVAAYGLILPQAALDAPRFGCINIHASLLPRWRGAAPIERAILAGDSETGVTIMRMEKGLDTGPMLLCERVPIAPLATAAGLRGDLATLGARLALRALDEIETLRPQPQPEDGITYAKKLDPRGGAHRLDEAGARARPASARAAPSWFEAKGERIKLLAAVPVEGPGRRRARHGARWGADDRLRRRRAAAC